MNISFFEFLLNKNLKDLLIEDYQRGLSYSETIYLNIGLIGFDLKYFELETMFKDLINDFN
jgi:hypothetical protein